MEAKKKKIFIWIAAGLWALGCGVLFFRFSSTPMGVKSNNLMVGIISSAGNFRWILPLTAAGMCAALLAGGYYIVHTFERFRQPRERLFLGIGGGTIVLILLYALMNVPAALFVLFLGCMAVGAGVILLAGGLGYWLLTRDLKEDPATTDPAEAAGLGLLVVSLFMFGLGLAGLLYTWLLWLLLIAGMAVLRRPIRLWLKRLAATVKTERQYTAWLPALIVLVVLMLGFMILPPLDYDVLEYHLGAPMHYARLGRFVAMEGNAYAAFPQNGEMLYLLGLVLGGKGIGGWYLAKLMNLYVGLILALGAAGLARRWRDERAGFWAAFLMLTATGFFVLALKPYVELYLALFTVLTIGRLYQAVRTKSKRDAALAGLFCGGAIGVKYTALLFLAVPGALWLGLACLTPAGRKALKSSLAGLVLFAGVGAAVAAPWLVKNAAAYGNPVFPLMGRVLGGGDWRPGDFERFDRGHRPPPYSLAQAAERLTRETVSGEGVHPLMLLLLPMVLLLPASRRAMLFGIGFFLIYFLLWYFFTHQLTRFMFPAAAVLLTIAGIGAAGLEEKHPWLLRSIMVFGLFYGFLGGVFYVLVPDFAYSWEQTDAGMVETKILPRMPSYAMPAYMNSHPDPEIKILLIGEAQTFYLARPFVMGTVFDRKWIEDAVMASTSPADLRQRIIDKGITHIYIDWLEMARFADTYGTYFLEFNWSLFETFLVQHCFLEQGAGDPIAKALTRARFLASIKSSRIPILRRYIDQRIAAGSREQRHLYEFYAVESEFAITD